MLHFFVSLPLFFAFLQGTRPSVALLLCFCFFAPGWGIWCAASGRFPAVSGDLLGGFRGFVLLFLGQYYRRSNRESHTTAPVGACGLRGGVRKAEKGNGAGAGWKEVRQGKMAGTARLFLTAIILYIRMESSQKSRIRVIMNLFLQGRCTMTDRKHRQAPDCSTQKGPPTFADRAAAPENTNVYPESSGRNRGQGRRT